MNEKTTFLWDHWKMSYLVIVLIHAHVYVSVILVHFAFTYVFVVALVRLHLLLYSLNTARAGKIWPREQILLMSYVLCLSGGCFSSSVQLQQLVFFSFVAYYLPQTAVTYRGRQVGGLLSFAKDLLFVESQFSKSYAQRALLFSLRRLAEDASPSHWLTGFSQRCFAGSVPSRPRCPRAQIHSLRTDADRTYVQSDHISAIIYLRSYRVSKKKVFHKSEGKMHKKMKMTQQRAKNLIHVQQNHGVSFYRKIFFIF